MVYIHVHVSSSSPYPVYAYKVVIAWVLYTYKYVSCFSIVNSYGDLTEGPALIFLSAPLPSDELQSHIRVHYTGEPILPSKCEYIYNYCTAFSLVIWQKSHAWLLSPTRVDEKQNCTISSASTGTCHRGA